VKAIRAIEVSIHHFKRALPGFLPRLGINKIGQRKNVRAHNNGYLAVGCQDFVAVHAVRTLGYWQSSIWIAELHQVQLNYRSRHHAASSV
jgi:hypothetical protein